MKNTRLQFTILFLICILALEACNAVAPAPTTTPMPTLTQTPVPPTATSTPTLTPTPIPMASVNEAVDCYAGPGVQYDKVASLETGVQVQISGESSDQAYWIVTTADGKECWLAKESVTATSGEIAGLPQLIPPATPTLGPPAAPSELSKAITCFKRPFILNNRKTYLRLQPEFILNWKDNSNNEVGYIIYKDGSEVKRIAANSTEYKDGVWITGFPATYFGPAIIYGVAAFNEAGISNVIEITVQISCT